MGNLLLLGESDVGKSHFGAQLLGRLNQEKGALRMQGAAETLQPFEVVSTSLNRGLSAPHTPRDTYVESRWPIGRDESSRVDLVWPEYDGEQLSLMKRERGLPNVWVDRVKAASGWIVMVRIPHAQTSDDIFTRALGSVRDDSAPAKAFSMSEQAGVIDFLQWLMFVRRTGSLGRISSPRLMLLLSCWDELPMPQLHQTPRQVLLSRLPLVAAFCEANWRPEALHVLGMSALGRGLSETEADEEYIDQGPENFGYVVLEDGRHDPDLTLAIEALL